MNLFQLEQPTTPFKDFRLSNRLLPEHKPSLRNSTHFLSAFHYLFPFQPPLPPPLPTQAHTKPILFSTTLFHYYSASLVPSFYCLSDFIFLFFYFSLDLTSFWVRELGPVKFFYLLLFGLCLLFIFFLEGGGFAKIFLLSCMFFFLVSLS